MLYTRTEILEPPKNTFLNRCMGHRGCVGNMFMGRHTDQDAVHFLFLLLLVFEIVMIEWPGG